MYTYKINTTLLQLKQQIANTFYQAYSDITLTEEEFAMYASAEADFARNYLWCLIDQMIYEVK